MSRTKRIKWLYSELPGLVDKDVLTEDAANKVQEFYGDVKGPSGIGIALSIFSIIGSLLIGAGMILLLAHNWQNMSRELRAVIAVAPLIFSHILGFWTIKKGRRTPPWREGVAIFNVCAVAAAIALIGQTYHIPGNLQNFLLVWMILILPMVYIFRALAVAIIYLIGITFWAGFAVDGSPGHSIWFVPLFLALLPYCKLEFDRDARSARLAIIAWVGCIVLPFGLCFAVGEDVIDFSWTLLLGSLFAVFYMTGSAWLKDKVSAWANPFRLLGSAGIACLAWLLTFGEVLDETSHREGLIFPLVTEFPAGTLALFLFVVAILLLGMAGRKRNRSWWVYGCMPLVVLAAQLLSRVVESYWIAVVLFNLYVLVISLTTIVSGIRRERLGIVNGGMILLTALIVARFFDVEMSFVWRGTVFIVIGIGFLVTNIVLGKRMKGGAE